VLRDIESFRAMAVLDHPSRSWSRRTSAQSCTEYTPSSSGRSSGTDLRLGRWTAQAMEIAQFSTGGKCLVFTRRRQAHHSGTTLDFVTDKNADSQDVQWFKTPGLTDLNQIRHTSAGYTLDITSRTDRSEMSVGASVCHYGRNSHFGCGQIASKSFDPGSGFNGTFIRVENDSTLAGDRTSVVPEPISHGTHKGITTSGGDPVFMAENYMGAFD
jgi:hypothetical protein